MVFMMSLVISNKLLAVAFRWLFLSFEPSDITVATKMTVAAIGRLDEFQVGDKGGRRTKHQSFGPVATYFMPNRIFY